jgi:hypothetical protein
VRETAVGRFNAVGERDRLRALRAVHPFLVADATPPKARATRQRSRYARHRPSQASAVDSGGRSS